MGLPLRTGTSSVEAPKSEWQVLSAISVWMQAIVRIIIAILFSMTQRFKSTLAPFKDGRKVIIWECVNVPAQQWYYTQDDRIALEGQGKDLFFVLARIVGVLFLQRADSC